MSLDELNIALARPSQAPPSLCSQRPAPCHESPPRFFALSLVRFARLLGSWGRAEEVFLTSLRAQKLWGAAAGILSGGNTLAVVTRHTVGCLQMLC